MQIESLKVVTRFAVADDLAVPQSSFAAPRQQSSTSISEATLPLFHPPNWEKQLTVEC